MSRISTSIVPALIGALSLAGGPRALAAQSHALETRILVRAVAHDAKVIGSGVGGARITIRDMRTGKILAEGVQKGSTGSTQAIMLEPRPRGLTAYAADPEAAGFLAVLELREPTPVEITAEGPLGAPQAMQRASQTVLLVPGRDVLGEGLVLVLRGFTVEILEPGPVERGSEEPVSLPAGPIPIRARVTMLCGCPTEPGGLWDADQIEVFARLLLDGQEIARAPLAFAGAQSQYEGRLPDPGPGLATVEVIAADTGRANFGRDRVVLRVDG